MNHILIKNIDIDYINSYIIKTGITDHFATVNSNILINIYIQHGINLTNNTDIKYFVIRNKNIQH